MQTNLYLHNAYNQPQLNLTASQMSQKIIEEVKREQQNKLKASIVIDPKDLPKCELHPITPSLSKCRQCKKNQEIIDEIKIKKQAEKQGKEYVPNAVTTNFSPN